MLLTILCSSVAVAVSIPLIRRYENAAAKKNNGAAVYQDQLKEVEKDQASGSISEPEAGQAKIEIQRRLLAAMRSPQVSRPLSPAWKGLALVSTAGLVILGSVNLYAYMGSPELSTAPVTSQTAQNAAASPTMPAPRAAASTAADEGQPMQVSDVIAKLAQRLKNNPADAEGWRMLGWSYFNTQRYQDSADAYSKAVTLETGNADYKSAYAEALVQAAEGVVTPKAKELVAEVLAKDAKESRARFYDALAHEQAGDQTGALDRWMSLLADAPLDAPWRDDVKQRVAELGKTTGRDVSTAVILPSLPASNQQQLGQADQNAVVAGMIAKLAAKLEQNPKDRDGWAMMIRSLTVSGDKTGAEQALAKALEIFKEDPATVEGLKSLSQSASQPAPANSAMPSTANAAIAPPITEEAKAAIQAMPAGDQQEMIKGMVARLATRLDGNPNDVDGWIKLLRAYAVLQDADKAKEAKGKALAAFSNDATSRSKIEAAAVELGMK